MVAAVTGAMEPRRMPATQMISPPASTSGVRARCHRGTPASIRNDLSLRSAGAPNGEKRSPRRRARTARADGSASASKAARPGSGGIA